MELCKSKPALKKPDLVQQAKQELVDLASKLSETNDFVTYTVPWLLQNGNQELVHSMLWKQPLT